MHLRDILNWLRIAVIHYVKITNASKVGDRITLKPEVLAVPPYI